VPTLLASPVAFDTSALVRPGRREARLRAFAAANGLVYDRRSPGAPMVGALFQLGHDHRTLRRFRGTWAGERFEVGNFALNVRPGTRCSEVLTGYLILGPLAGPVAGFPEPWFRMPAPDVLPTTHVERSAATTVAHTLEPLDLGHPGTWQLIEALRRALSA
jgi:hypothetical protein